MSPANSGETGNNVERIRNAVGEFTDIATDYVFLQTSDGLATHDLRGIRVNRAHVLGVAVTDMFAKRGIAPPSTVKEADIRLGHDKASRQFQLLEGTVQYDNSVSIHLEEARPTGEYIMEWTTPTPAGTPVTVVKAKITETEAMYLLYASSLPIPDRTDSAQSQLESLGQLYNAARHRIITTHKRTPYAGAHELIVSDSISTVNPRIALSEYDGPSSSRDIRKSVPEVIQARANRPSPGSGWVQETTVGITDYEGNPALMAEAILHREDKFSPLRLWKILRHQFAQMSGREYDLHPAEIVATEPIAPTVKNIEMFTMPLRQLLMGPSDRL